MTIKQIGVGTFSTTPLMRQYINDVLDKARISYGEYSLQFEQEFAALHDSFFAVLSNSGTSSLHVAIQALKELHGWQDGDEIIVPAVTFVASVNVILHNRLKPVLVDIDSRYYEIDAEQVEDKLTDRTRAIMPVHLFGQPCDMTAIRDIADARNLAIIEDSCEAMFVKHNRMAVGAWGDVGCFSTYVAHLISTGVGGLATTNIPELAIKMRSLVNHGRDGIYMSIDDNDADNLREVIERRFNFESIGHSFRITELEAALGLAQLATWQDMIAKRQRNASTLIDTLAGQTNYLQLPETRPLSEHSWMMFPLILLKEPKFDLCEYLEQHGIETREMLPLVNQPCYAGLWDSDDYPIAQWVDRCGLYVGCHQDLSETDMQYIGTTICNYWEQRGKIKGSY